MVEKQRKRRNLCEAWHLSVRDWQTINTVIHQGVALIHLTAQLMETIRQANQGWFRVSGEGGRVNANKMSTPIKCEWQPSVFHWQRIYNKPNKHSCTISICSPRAWIKMYPFARGFFYFFIVFYSYPSLCYRATLLQSLNNLWSGTWQSVINYPLNSSHLKLCYSLKQPYLKGKSTPKPNYYV